MTVQRHRFARAAAGNPHPDGRIVCKANNLSHRKIIEALYEASQAGASIDLIIRSICRLRPEVRELSESIRARAGLL